jgi:hypothetical protein
MARFPHLQLYNIKPSSNSAMPRPIHYHQLHHRSSVGLLVYSSNSTSRMAQDLHRRLCQAQGESRSGSKLVLFWLCISKVYSGSYARGRNRVSIWAMTKEEGETMQAHDHCSWAPLNVPHSVRHLDFVDD